MRTQKKLTCVVAFLVCLIFSPSIGSAEMSCTSLDTIFWRIRNIAGQAVRNNIGHLRDD